MKRKKIYTPPTKVEESWIELRSELAADMLDMFNELFVEMDSKRFSELLEEKGIPYTGEQLFGWITSFRNTIAKMASYVDGSALPTTSIAAMKKLINSNVKFSADDNNGVKTLYFSTCDGKLLIQKPLPKKF